VCDEDDDVMNMTAVAMNYSLCSVVPISCRQGTVCLFNAGRRPVGCDQFVRVGFKTILV